MKRIFAVVLIIITTVSLQGCGTPQVNVNENDSVVITLDDEQGCGISQVNVNEIDGVVLTLDEKQGWEPDKNIINEFEEKLIPYINNFKCHEDDEASLEFVKKNIRKYKRQYMGIIINGKEVLFCNFLLLDEKDDSFSDWRSRIIIVNDGGPKYFTIKYDVESKNFSELLINGYA